MIDYIAKLENLSKARNKFRSEIYNDKLTKLGLQEQLETSFKPITAKLEGVTKAIENIPPSYPELKMMKELPIDGIFEEGVLQGLPNCLRPVINENGLTIGGKSMKCAEFNNTAYLYEPNQPNLMYELTEGVTDLVKGGDFVSHSNKDLKIYYEIIKNLKPQGYSNTNRYKILKDRIDPNLNIREVDGEGILIISDNINELFNRLNILLSARKEGHNSSFNEINAILKRLLEKKAITTEQYKLFI